MAVQLTIPFEALLEAIEHLTPEEKAVIAHLVQPPTELPAMTTDEKWRRLQSVMIAAAPGESFSFRREDWYDDDGR
jgi:predicted dinucleotide-binding enzyme